MNESGVASPAKALADAILAELADKGYGGCSLETARLKAGLPGDGSGDDFTDRDACLFDAYEQLAADLIATTESGCAEGTEWPQRVALGLGGLLQWLAARPAMARVMVRDFPAIGPEAQRRYVGLLEALVLRVEEGSRHVTSSDELPGGVGMMAVGAAESLIVAEIDGGRTRGLPAMLPDLLFSVLVPFLGPERAAAEMRAAAQVRAAAEQRS